MSFIFTVLMNLYILDKLYISIFILINLSILKTFKIILAINIFYNILKIR